jgi:hypothetical protein
MLGRSDELGRREGECGAWRLGGQRSSADLLDLPFTFSELGQAPTRLLSHIGLRSQVRTIRS